MCWRMASMVGCSIVAGILGDIAGNIVGDMVEIPGYTAAFACPLVPSSAGAEKVPSRT